jgi:hypothetical protein
MPELSEDDDRFLIYRTAYWIDQGMSIAEAKAESELPFKDSIEIPKKTFGTIGHQATRQYRLIVDK